MKHLFEDPKHTSEAIQLLKEGGDEVYIKLYHYYWKPFLSWGKKKYSKLQEVEIEDALQEAIVKIFKKLDRFPLNYSIKNYLFGIFKNELLHKWRDQNKKATEEISNTFGISIKPDIYKKIDNEHLSTMIKQGFHQLGATCKKLLTLLIYKRYAPDAIARELKYSNVNVVYSRTHTCLQELRDLLK